MRDEIGDRGSQSLLVDERGQGSTIGRCGCHGSGGMDMSAFVALPNGTTCLRVAGRTEKLSDRGLDLSRALVDELIALGALELLSQIE